MREEYAPDAMTPSNAAAWILSVGVVRTPPCSGSLSGAGIISRYLVRYAREGARFVRHRHGPVQPRFSFCALVSALLVGGRNRGGALGIVVGRLRAGSRERCYMKEGQDGIDGWVDGWCGYCFGLYATHRVYNETVRSSLPVYVLLQLGTDRSFFWPQLTANSSVCVCRCRIGKSLGY